MLQSLQENIVAQMHQATTKWLCMAWCI